MDILDRARGALLGMSIGEALGAPLEGLTPEEIEQKVGRPAGYVDAAKTQSEHRAGYFEVGVYEDESQAALATADALLKARGFNVEALRDRLEELGQPIEGNFFGCYRRPRRNLRSAVRRMLAGAPWQECGVNTAGSGAASRGIPLGIWYRDDPEGLLRAAVEASLLTHRDPRACAATAAVAAMTAELLTVDAQAFEAEQTLDAVVAATRRAEDLMAEHHGEVLQEGYDAYLHQFSEALIHLKGLLDLDLEEALERIVAFAAGKGSRPITNATKGFALTAIVTALYFFLTGPETFAETLLDTVCEGGNADTLGCIVGGLAGALHGRSGIPEAWLAGLRNREQIEARGEALGGGERPSLQSLLLMEAQTTRPAPRPVRKRRIARRPPASRPPRGARRPPGRPGGGKRPPAYRSRGRPGGGSSRGGPRGPGQSGRGRRPPAGPGGPPRRGHRPGGPQRGGPRPPRDPGSRGSRPSGP